MNADYLFILIMDGLENQKPLFNELGSKNHFDCIFLDYKDLQVPDFAEKVKKRNAVDIIFGVECSFYSTIENELKKVLENWFPDFQPRVLKLSLGSAESEINQPYILDRDRFFLSDDAPGPIQIANLIGCFFRLCHESTLSFQLYDYLSASIKEMVSSELLMTKQQEIKRLNEELDRKSKMDHLTSLYNREAFYSKLHSEINRIKRQQWRIEQYHNMDADDTGPPELLNHIGQLSFMMIDIDHFKRINDTYGHLVGDEVLKELSSCLRHSKRLRSSDIVARFGGEEFAVILPETNAENAAIAARNLKEAVKAISFSDRKDNHFGITISIGVSQYLPEDDKNQNLMIERADIALYKAKKNGRDRIEIFSES